tara:strand:- start:26341 stop:29619 length:3279 start_codon:yes stop_codon:yes gene_type:complete
MYRDLQFKLLSAFTFAFLISTSISIAQGTRLLREPSISSNQIAFTYGSDVWVSNHDGSDVIRITSTPAIESDPHFSPDGKWIAFSSNRSGSFAVYIVSAEGGEPTRLTWHPSSAYSRGWSPDGKKVLYASSRESAPTSINRLWTVSTDGGPSTKLSEQWGFDGSFSPNGRQLVVDKMSRWESEFRNYKGGQNTPLIILNLQNQNETLLPFENTIDLQPVWVGGLIYFLSDRDWTTNVWSFDVSSKELKQITKFKGTDVKWLSAGNNELIVEQNGYLHTVDPATGNTTQLEITIKGDFPWASTKWEDVSDRAQSVSLSATGVRVLASARGDIYTIPVENGDARNLTQSSDAADREPVWSPNGDQIAWFSDEGQKGYSLHLIDQDGLSNHETIDIGESKMAWETTWSPDGSKIAFVDDDVRVRVIELTSKTIKTVAIGGNNLDRGAMDLTWAPDSKQLAFATSGSNNFKKIMIWSSEDNSLNQITNPFADAFAPSWDRDKKHFYFLASTDVALGSGWANTSAMTADPTYAAYVIVLQKDQDSPFIPKSDEEKVKEKEEEDKSTEDKEDGEEEEKSDDESEEIIQIDYDRIDRRTIALPIPEANYTNTEAGPAGSVFISERGAGFGNQTLHKFSLESGEAETFLEGIRSFTISSDGSKILSQAGSRWSIAGTAGASGKSGDAVSINLQMNLNRQAEWKQMFEEAWRYERDYFYDPELHGRDWDVVYNRYAPLVPFIKHRADLTYILDQMNGELSVGHSFVFGGDFPSTDRSTVGLLGADLVTEKNRWKINRIYTTESWNPSLSSPLDRPGMKVQEGYYLVGINGKELKASDDPYKLLDGTAGKQTLLHLNEKPEFDDSWTEIAEPIRSENALRQRAWVEDNRRMVDELSNGKLAYIWVPNTGGPGFVSFNRYYFAQQDKEGAVIDERFNGGGLLDDYMVDLMTRSLRAGLTNEVPNGKAFRLPAGILGPKALLINELAGSGGDFFPWVFRQQNAGPLIGARTWGGLVKSSVHYALVDGGALTAPDNAVFDPINNKFIAENEGVAPDIAVRQNAKALSEGKDPQLERAVQEVLRLLDEQGTIKVVPPPYNKPAIKN